MIDPTMNANGRYILNALGEPQLCPDLVTWAQWYEVADRTLELTPINEHVRVSTVFLALDHNFTRTGQPLLWETLVFGGSFDGEQYRYHTRQQAHVGHERMVAKCGGRAAPVSTTTRRIDLD
jgi:hypothetical protein